MSEDAPRLDVAAFVALARESLPIFAAWNMEAVEIGHGTATLRLGHDEGFLRPGGTVGGPILMGLADVAMFAALLGAIGPVPGAVTSSLSINFLRKPPPAGLRAEAKLLKLGRRLAVGEVALFGESEPEMVAHVVATYAIPA